MKIHPNTLNPIIGQSYNYQPHILNWIIIIHTGMIPILNLYKFDASNGITYWLSKDDWIKYWKVGKIYPRKL